MQRRFSNKLLCCFILALLANFCAWPAWSCSSGCSGGAGCTTASLTFAMPKASITADTLANLLKSGSQVTLLECRSSGQQKDLRIPGAIVIFDDAMPASISASLPATDTLIILYPGLEGSRIASISETLHNMGYLSILEYNDGVYGWITYGYEPAGENFND